MVVGDVKSERVEQVKGATYSLRAFLGLMPTVTDPQKNSVGCLVRALLQTEDLRLPAYSSSPELGAVLCFIIAIY